MRKCELKDFDALYSLMTNEDLAGDIQDDYAQTYQSVRVLLSSPTSIVLMPSKGTAFVFRALNSILHEAHLIVTNAEKESVYENTGKAAQWIKDNTLAETLISHIPVGFDSTLYYSEKIGMEKIGVIKDGYAKYGKRLDVVIMGCPVDEIIRRLKWQQQ